MVDVTKLAKMVRENLGITHLDAEDFYYDPETDEMWCSKTLYELGTDGTLWYLMQVLDSKAFDWLGDNVYLERGKPLWKNSKPLSIIKAKVLPDRAVLLVEGKKTDRIEQKWKKQFSKKLANVPVEFKWVKTYETYQVLESGG